MSGEPEFGFIKLRQSILIDSGGCSGLFQNSPVFT
ncbi:MAG: hypothetical protein K0R57_1135 [Paenibacillaceae bacterium]|jgi:hypothetical protein|nr:hypothetical protein [Paenibacillaceae bacterium]